MKHFWPDDHMVELKRLINTGAHSFSEIAVLMNENLGTRYTRNAVIGKARRMGECTQRPQGDPAMAIEREKARWKKVAEQRKAKRWAANPSLAERRARTRKQTSNRQLMLAYGATKTSAQYRRHFPRMTETSKAALRAMLTMIVQNTAAL